MQYWLNELDGLLNILALDPPTPMQKWVIVAVTVFFMILVFGMVASMMRIPNTDPARSTGLVVVGSLLMMLGAVAAGKYLAPRVGGELGHWTPLAAAAAVLLIAVIPLSCLWQRSKYMETLITWVGSLVAAVIAVFLATAVFDAVAAGKKETSKAGKHNREIKELLGR